MSTVQLSIVCVTWLATVASIGVIILVNSRSKEAASLVGKTVVINTVQPDNQTVRGLVHADDPERITLTQAVYYEHGGNEHAAGGLLHVFKDKISSTQEVTPPEPTAVAA